MGEVRYKSTRGTTETVTASQAILQGLAPDGGLYLPTKIPSLSIPMEQLQDMSYQQVAYEIMKLFLTDFSKEELLHCIEQAYDDKFDTKEIAPVTKLNEATYVLELYHGATIAFKDMALSILPYLMTVAIRKQQVKREIVILTATSGDTGKAALEGFADVTGTKIIVFYPKDGVSMIQKLQMVTSQGENTAVIALRGNFDHAQTGVKELFEKNCFKEELLERGYQLSSANSINIGRLIPQIVYYVYAYARLSKEQNLQRGEKIDVVVPTGNFGNILAAYYAKQMGVPIEKLVCASNENKVLFDFFRTGVYDSNREFHLTISPSMDILVSSNLERLLYLVEAEAAKLNRQRIKQLKQTGAYKITEKMQNRLSDFVGGYATEQQVKETIAMIYKKHGYLLDPHTAVAETVRQEYQRGQQEGRKMLVVSTASPYKFAGSVMTAIDKCYETWDEFALLGEMERISGKPIPQAIREIQEAQIYHQKECDRGQMEEVVRSILK